MTTSTPFGSPGPSGLDEIRSRRSHPRRRAIWRSPASDREGSPVPLSRVQVVLAVLVQLVGADDVAGAVRERVDGEAFPVAAEAAASEVRELAARVGVVRIRMPLVDTVRLVRVIDVPERVVHRHGFDFVLLPERGRAEVSEASHESGTDAAAARIDQPVLPEIILPRPFLG